MTHLALGIDLASASWADNGSALVELDRDASRFLCVAPGAIPWPNSPLTAPALADAIDAFARSRGVAAVALDGPAGWRDPDTPPELPGVGRRSEYACRTQGKTGAYPKTYPKTQRAWIEHCIAVFDALLDKPGVVLAHEPDVEPPAGGYLLLECFPTSNWRVSGLTPLPGKGKKPKLGPFVDALRAAYALPSFSTDSHDDLQGVVCALAAVAALGGPARAITHGVPSRVVDSGWLRRRVEGVIWDATPLGGPVAVAMPVSAAPSSSPIGASPIGAAPSSPAISAPSACVTSAVLVEVNRTGNAGSMCIALRGAPGGTRAALVRVALRIGDAQYALMVGDSHAAWRSHQTPETEDDFELLFAQLAEQPDVRVAVDEVREGGEA